MRVYIIIVEDISAETNIASINLLATTTREDPKEVITFLILTTNTNQRMFRTDKQLQNQHHYVRSHLSLKFSRSASFDEKNVGCIFLGYDFLSIGYRFLMRKSEVFNKYVGVIMRCLLHLVRTYLQFMNLSFQ
jgi:hypothetical protein